MGAPSRTVLILGSAPISFLDLEVAERLQLVQWVLNKGKPYLKYLSDFKPLGERLNGYQGPSASPRTTDLKLVSFPVGIDQATLCIQIVSTLSDMKGEVPGHGVRFFQEEGLFLSREGKLLRCQMRFERQLRSRPNGDPRYQEAIEVAHLVHFFLVFEEELTELLGNSDGRRAEAIWRSLFTRLFDAVSDEIEERKKRLQVLKQLRSSLEGVSHRVH